MRARKYDRFSDFDEDLAKIDPADIRKGPFFQNLRLCDEPISKILREWTLEENEEGKCKIETGIGLCDSDSNLLSKVMPKSLLLKWVVNICLSASKSWRSDSKAEDIAIEYFDALVTSYEKRETINFSLFIHYAFLTLYKFPEFKKRLASRVCEKLGQANIKSIEKLRFLNELLLDNKLSLLCSESQFLEFMVGLADLNYYEPPDFDFVLYFYVDVALRLRSPVNKQIKKTAIKLALVPNAGFSRDVVREKYRHIIDFMHEVGGYSADSYKFVNDRLDSANGFFAKQANLKFAYLSPEVNKMIIETQEQISKQLKPLSQSDKLCYLLNYTSPFNLKDFKAYIDDMDNVDFGDLFSIEYPDDSGALNNYKNLTEDENLSCKFREPADNHLSIWDNCFFQPFVQQFSPNYNCCEFISNRLSASVLFDGVNILDPCLIMASLNRDIPSACVFILRFEEVLRRYMKRKGLTIYKKDKNLVEIGLNNIFDNNSKNEYRDFLLKTIDYDHYFTLKWLLTDKYGQDIRNKIAHGKFDGREPVSSYFWFAVCLILKLYMDF